MAEKVRTPSPPQVNATTKGLGFKGSKFHVTRGHLERDPGSTSIAILFEAWQAWWQCLRM